MRRIGFWEALSIGIGGMIGGGIFAVLGLSLELSGGAAPVSFLLGGIVALFTAYSYAKLTQRFPSRGGTIEYLVRGFGGGMLSGTLNLVLLASYVVMISLYAYAFGSYLSGLLGAEGFLKHLFIAFPVVFFTLINAMGAFVSGRTEDVLVAFKVAILLLVALAGLALTDFSRLSPEHWGGLAEIIGGAMVIFLAYEGFELIANSGRDVKNPKVLPKAFYLSVIIVTAIYVLVSVVAAGTVSAGDVEKYRDFVLAMVAEPIFGNIGFVLVVLAALLSTSSAINATLYGTARASYMVAKYGQLPEAVEKPIWGQAYEGLVIISVLSLVMANAVSLESISIAGSSGFLLVFMFVNLAALRLRKYLGINPVVPVIGSVASGISLAVLIYISASAGLFFGIIVSCFVFEFVYRKLTGREITEYVDVFLSRLEEAVVRWESWIHRVGKALREVMGDVEIYIVGSALRGNVKRVCDVDVLVITGKTPESREEIVRKVRRRAGLGPEHAVHLHFVEKSRKKEALRKAGRYRKI